MKIKIAESGTCVHSDSMTRLRSLPLFEANVIVSGESKRKQFVSLIDKNDRILWADIVTGTLYDAETGKCVGTSHMWIPAQKIKSTKPAELKEFES